MPLALSRLSAEQSPALAHAPTSLQAGVFVP